MWRKIFGAIVIAIGFALSPLSWWNDLFINLPIAFFFGCVLGAVNEKLFLPGVIVGYWFSNVLGVAMMHFGFLKFRPEKKYSRRDLVRDLCLALAYTALIVLLFKLGIITLPANLF